MGLCGSSLTADEKASASDSHRMDQVLVAKQEEEQRVIKLLLLGTCPAEWASPLLPCPQPALIPECCITGTGESGKSTIFKQMQILYCEEGFT